MKFNYEILRVMNNNVVLAKNLKKHTEVVLMGNGIGFGRKKGQQIESDLVKVEKSFEADHGNSLKQSYIKMLEEVNEDIVEICTEILLVAENKLGELSDRSFIVVVDHISFAIEKLTKNIKIDNPFSFEIQQLYPEEFAIGEYARKRIIEELDVDITMDEVGFIALHLNAAKQHKVVTDTLKSTRIIKNMVNLIEQELDVDLKELPRLNNRFLIHLRGLLQRIDDEEVLEKHVLYEETIKQCREAFKLVLKVEKMLNKEHKSICETDKFYLTLHIDRMIRKIRHY